MNGPDMLIWKQTAHKRVAAQRHAKTLLFKKTIDASIPVFINLPEFEQLQTQLSAASEIFLPNAVQQEIYSADTGTHIVPSLFKKLLLKTSLAFIFRPGSVTDLQYFVKWAYANKIKYTIRGAGTWPFGGCVPQNGDVVVDLSYLDLIQLNSEEESLTIGAGVVFTNARKYLKKHGFALRQEITNASSGSIIGWIATGGLGLGSYKYGHVREAVLSLNVVTPGGELKTLTPGDPTFENYFGSEGHFGIIVGATIKIRKESYIQKPFALAFDSIEAAQQFIEMLVATHLKPTSLIYFDESYIKETVLIEETHLNHQVSSALEMNDLIRVAAAREDLAALNELGDNTHVVLLHFDEKCDYEQALKSRLFGASGEQRRVNQIRYRQLSTSLAHRLWEHRYLPVQMKQKGPSMLVSEMVLPLTALNQYHRFLRSILGQLLDINLKLEAHLLQNGEVLVQSIFLADTRTLRHKIYYALVPLMNEAALQFGGKPYGFGIWNYPLVKNWRQQSPEKYNQFKHFKKKSDPFQLINQGKFLNPRNQTVFFKLFKLLVPRLNQWLVRILVKQTNNHLSVPSRLALKIIGRFSAYIFPKIVPPTLKINRQQPISELIAACAECDSCERVCPTSDVFGIYGPATPITRRITAKRLIEGKTIPQEEALGFLVCTRCDNCTRACPTNIPLTTLFELVEADKKFQSALDFKNGAKEDFIERFWQIMQESPLYREHTLADQKEERSHLAHGIKIYHPRGFEYGNLYIDPLTCIHCGMCSDQNACMYGAREGRAREIPELFHINCALCNACVNFCPQNKTAQDEREFLDQLILHAPDLEEKRYWNNQQTRILDTTTVQRSNLLTEMADRYVTEEIIMEIDKESSTGKIPVSGMGQGDRHAGIGFDAERFSHFHIVGPAQNRLHEGDPAEELSVILGKREDFCKFDRAGNLLNPQHPTIKLMTPILYNAIPLESNGNVELAFIKVAEQQKSLVVITLERLLEHYEFFLEHGQYAQLPPVIMPRVDHELIHRLAVNPRTNREFLTDLWRMPAFEVEYHPQLEPTLNYIRDSVKVITGDRPLFIGYLEISEYDLIGSLTANSEIKTRINHFLDQGIDILHLHGLRNKDEYYVTSQAVRALHHYLMRIGRRHEVSLIASGGIRLASDTQKTIQRGAEATLIDFAALLALDPSTYRAIIETKATTEKLLSLDLDWAVQRLNNQAESRKIQILEVLGAAGFKDIKKTVGEEGRLIDFHKLENRIQRTIFEDPNILNEYIRLNQQLISAEPIPEAAIRPYSTLKQMIRPTDSPHHFYRLGKTNQSLYNRDYVWSGQLIESIGRMAAGDKSLLDFKNVQATGLVGDGFDVMKILYSKDPMDIPETALDAVKTALPLDKDLVLEAPWMLSGKSVGSIGLDSWKAHVTAARKLGIQYDTGEGGYPTCFFLNAKGEPIFFTENEIQRMRPFFRNGINYTIQEMQDILAENGITAENYPGIYQKIQQYPSLKPFHFLVIVGEGEEPFISTELKTGLFGVTKDTIKKARRVVIAYSQGAKMGIGGHILAKKVNKLVSYMRGIEGLEILNRERLENLFNQLQKIQQNSEHVLHALAESGLPILDTAQQANQVTDELKAILLQIQETVLQLNAAQQIDEIEFENINRLTEEIIEYSYISIISPFPFHNCYSIEDVKAFIDVVRMINPNTVVAIKVSPSIDIEFIATGLGRIARDNTEAILNARFENYPASAHFTAEMAEYAQRYGMKIEIWLDGPRGGTGASPNIIKGQMGMHLEYAIPLIHHRLVKDGLRNYVKFIVSGGIRTYEDVIKAIALGADGVNLGTLPMVAIGCDRNHNCQDGCSRGIATSNLILQKLRDVEKNTCQMINALVMLQMQVIRALAALGCDDIRQLRGRFDKIHWLGLKERVDNRFRLHQEIIKEIEKDEQQFEERLAHATGQSNCGVAAINGTVPIPAYILDQTLQAMRNRGMDGVGIAKTLCFPHHPRDYAYRIMVKGVLPKDVEQQLTTSGLPFAPAFNRIELQTTARQKTLEARIKLMQLIQAVFLDPYFEYQASTDPAAGRETYKKNADGHERDYRDFGSPETDPGDIFCFFVQVKKSVLFEFIEKELFHQGKPRLLAPLFPGVTLENYQQDQDFLEKAADLFVFNHSVNLTRILYVSSILPAEFQNFAEQEFGFTSHLNEADLLKTPPEIARKYLEILREFLQTHPFEHHRHRYAERQYKMAAVMSCGKNFAAWKTAGREIPWETPAAPNNIIHVRLATGSVVEQMNAHPFTKLHTALTHNGETTNYEALRQRVEQFNLSPLATTDTEVASLKFHLTADVWEYPDWALFESFSPTTGDDQALIDPEIRRQLEQVQRVEFASSPDGPYQYLCLRHNPTKQLTERVDLKDPADLRPNVSAFWYDLNREQPQVLSIIASEEHAIHTMLELLDREGIIDGGVADKTFVSTGMISRYQFDEQNQIQSFAFLDRYNRPIELEDVGQHYSWRREKLTPPPDPQQGENWQADYRQFFVTHLKELSFNDFRWLLQQLVTSTFSDEQFTAHLEILTWLRDYVRTLDPGTKAHSSLIGISQFYINTLLDSVQAQSFKNYVWVNQALAADFQQSPQPTQHLIIDATGFLPEGTDPERALGSFLARAYDTGWRHFILYRVQGQRLISTALLGRGDTDDVTMEVYGAPGEYFGAFMKGGVIRLHGNAQNFCGMCMHHGQLYVFGHAGKVCGYASKGGKVFIMGDIVDRGWTNSVNDSRTQNLEVLVLGSATKYLGESLMGGQFFFAGLHFDSRGHLRLNERPYLGTKMFGGASRGTFLFFDPANRLIEAQYQHGKLKAFTPEEWQFFAAEIKETFRLSNIAIHQKKGQEYIIVEGKKVALVAENFKLVVPKGGLKGYESH